MDEDMLAQTSVTVGRATLTVTVRMLLPDVPGVHGRYVVELRQDGDVVYETVVRYQLEAKRRHDELVVALRAAGTVSIRLPRVAVSPELAARLIADAAPSAGDEVVLDGRGLVLCESAFTDEFVRLLAARSPTSVLFSGGPPQWHEQVRAAASAVGLPVTIKANYLREGCGDE